MQQGKGRADSAEKQEQKCQQMYLVSLLSGARFLSGMLYF
jgi:hypothetical protein